MKTVPFYSNRQDDMSCMLAVYRSVADFFLNLKLSWAELERITGFHKKKAAWSIKTLVYFAESGMDIRMIEPIDYSRLAKEGNDYLRTLYSQSELEWLLANSDIGETGAYVPKFLQLIRHEERQATLKDVDIMLLEGRLVYITVNTRALNRRVGFVSHAVLVLSKTNKFYILHDPGLPPKPNRRVSAKVLWEAMGGNENAAEVTGFKLGPAT